MSSSRRSRRRRSKVDLSAVNANTELALVDGIDPEERRASISGRYSPTLLLVAVLASIGVLAYAASSSTRTSGAISSPGSSSSHAS